MRDGVGGVGAGGGPRGQQGAGCGGQGCRKPACKVHHPGPEGQGVRPGSSSPSRLADRFPGPRRLLNQSKSDPGQSGPRLPSSVGCRGGGGVGTCRPGGPSTGADWVGRRGGTGRGWEGAGGWEGRGQGREEHPIGFQLNESKTEPGNRVPGRNFPIKRCRLNGSPANVLTRCRLYNETNGGLG